MRPLSDRERKLVALLILFALLALAYLLVVAPILNGISDRALRREMLTRQYVANQRAIATIPRLLHQARKQRADLHGLVIEAANTAAGSVALQEQLQRDIEAVGGEMREVADTSGDDGLVRARGAARLTLEQLVRLLTALQNQAPHVTTESLTISADRALVSGHLEPMDVSLEISIPLARPAAK
jgi:hypothetical protein